MKMKILAAAVAFVASTSSVFAATVEWTYSALFADASSASGTLQFDNSTNTFLNVNISYSGGPNYGAAAFTETVFSGPNLAVFVQTGTLPDATGAVALNILLAFGDNFGAIPATVSLTDLSTCASIDCATQGGPFVVATEYSLTGRVIDMPAVPIPASLPLLAFGLGGLGLMARRKHKAA